jgi:prophage DNA circulation protein
MLKGIASQHQENKKFFNDLVQQGKDTRDAMVGFVEKNEATVSTLGKSAAGMSKAASTMGSSATHLQEVINSFRSNMESVVDLMKTDLNATITGMNKSFSENMSEMSKGLNIATNDISHAVNTLSSSVDATMNEVTTTINTSMNLQKEAQKVFIQSTDELSEYVNEMTSLVNKLSDDIVGGLKAVSDSNRNMINLANKTQKLTDTVDVTFKESLQSIESVTTLKPTLEKLTHGIDSQIGLLNQIVTNTAKNTPQKNKPRIKWGQ